MCFSAQRHAGWMGTGKHLKTYINAKKESMNWKSLIEQLVKAQNILIEHSKFSLGNPL